jgi:prevent-host-death family protein
MKALEIGAGEFKARCLKLLDEVARSGSVLTVTKRGKPVAQVVPVVTHKDLFGALGGSVLAQERIVEPVGAEWHAER